MTVFYNIRQIVRKILVMKYNFNVYLKSYNDERLSENNNNGSISNATDIRYRANIHTVSKRHQVNI